MADRRCAPDLVAFSAHADASELVRRGPLTPDHVIRTWPSYLFLTAEQARDAEACRQKVSAFASDYSRYFEQNNERVPDGTAMRQPGPRVVVVEGAGLVAFGDDKRAAVIAADMAAQTLRSMARANAIGRYEPLSSAGVFDLEYWPLELKKLGRQRRPVLGGQVGLVTGAAGAIGHGIADALLRAGCHVVLTDVSEARLAVVEQKLTERHPAERVISVAADVTRDEDVARVFRCARLEFGGVDVVVPNAGIAYVSAIADMDADQLRKVLDVNVTGTMIVLKHAAAVFTEQCPGLACV